MANSDLGHKLTDKELAKLERRIARLYREAGEELQATIDAYFEQFKKRDEEMKALIGTVRNGKEWTEQDYKQWRLNQIGRGERYQVMRDKVAHRMTDANAVAVSYTNDATPGIYSLNRNYAAYTIEQVAGNVGFDLWDEQTVKRLIVEQPDLMPYYPPKRALKRGIDLAYGKKQITKSVTSSILQGKSIKHMADDLQRRITTMSRDSAIRTARTAATGAQNAGRMDSYAAAQKMGIKLKKEWLATLDARTRHSHAMLDGEQVAQDKKFSNGCRFPGDPQGPPWEIYNCRCTLIAAVEGVDTSTAQRRARNADTGQTEVVSNMTYAEWVGWKKDTAQVVNAGKSAIIKEKTEPAEYRQFDTGDAANDFFYYDGEERGLLAKKRSKHAQWQKSLSEAEDYAIGDYTGGGYYDINAYLRKTGDWENINSAFVEQQIKGLDSAISRYELKENIRVQRGVMNDVLDRLVEDNDVKESLSELVGKKFRESAYSSTTVVQGNGVATAKPTIFDIEIPAGVGRGAYVNQLAGQFQDTEYEFLLKRGATFTIKEVREEEIMGEYRYYIKMVMDDE
jgi:SPP1 gp7 family putative phage head morphogenesis protein|nr:MAG TPA: minor capsid protein [Caudoviricetes sp.]